MPGWVQAMNFLSARLRRAVFILLMLAAVQAIPSVFSASVDDETAADRSLTLRRAID
jgi:hypothetical protein